MNETTINYEGQNYTREVEMLGDVEKISFFKEGESLEIFDTDLCLALESVYEAIIFEALVPILPLI